MKIKVISFFFFFDIFIIFSQNTYVFKFENYHNKHPLKIDSIRITNVTRKLDTVLYYPNDIFEVTEFEIPFNLEQLDTKRKFSVITNSTECKTYFQITIPFDQIIVIHVTDISGRIIQQYRKRLHSGRHYFSVKGGGDNISVITLQSSSIKESVQLINFCDERNVIIEHLYSENPDENIFEHNNFILRKGDSLKVETFSMDFDDQLFANSEIFVPTESRIIRFDKFTDYKALVIMYHKITTDTATDIYERSVWDFENDLLYMKNKGYKVVSIEDLYEVYHEKKGFKGQTVIITFDDGFSSDYTLATPLLKYHKMPATFFIVPGWVSVFSDYLTWPQVWELSQERDTNDRRMFHIGSHTMYHPFLEDMANQMSPEDYQKFLDEEIGESRDWIVDVTGQEKLFLALPFGNGANNQQIINTCKKFGYTGIRHSIWGNVTRDSLNIWSIPYLPILSFTNIAVIDDWLE